MININPPPVKIPESIGSGNQEALEFVRELQKSNYMMWEALHGNKNDILINTVENIDATQTGLTELFKTPENKTFIPTRAIIRMREISGNSHNALVSIGVNSPDYRDFVTRTSYNLNDINSFLIARPYSSYSLVKVNAGQTLQLNITSAANSSVEKWDIDLFGYFV